MTTTSTGLQADNDRHSSLNDITAHQVFPARTATMTATMTQVPAMTTAISKATIKLVECFLHPAKTGANNATVKSESLLPRAQIGSAITAALNAQISCCFPSETTQQLCWQRTPFTQFS
jgi:hypothetical protein